MNLDKPLIIYGAGQLGKLAKQYFRDIERGYQCIVDSDPSVYKDDPSWRHDIIWRVEELSHTEKEESIFVVCITTASYNKIKENLESQGCKNIIAFYTLTQALSPDFLLLANGWLVSNVEETKTFLKIQRSFSDKISQEHYDQFRIWHEYNLEKLSDDAPVTCNDRFFIPEITNILHDHEVFIDGGAYDGCVTFKFLNIVKSKFSEIYMFEPDKVNIKVLRDNIYLLNNRNIYILNRALGEKNLNIGFSHGHGFYSKVDRKSKDFVSMNTIDSFNIRPTFIKYHLEGYELNAIKGSIEKIKKYRPIIAVTTYHTAEGLLELPLYLIDNLKDYKFLWRNHNYQGQGAVMYCIPNERVK